MVSVTAKDSSNVIVERSILDGGQGPWLAGPEGFRKLSEDLSVIDDDVVIRGQGFAPMIL